MNCDSETSLFLLLRSHFYFIYFFAQDFEFCCDLKFLRIYFKSQKYTAPFLLFGSYATRHTSIVSCPPFHQRSLRNKALVKSPMGTRSSPPFMLHSTVLLPPQRTMLLCASIAFYTHLNTLSYYTIEGTKFFG